MNPATAVVLATVLGVISVGTACIIFKLMGLVRWDSDWKLVTNQYTNVRVRGQSKLSDLQLVRLSRLVDWCLAALLNEGRVEVDELGGIYIFVHATPTWVAGGQEVGGLTLNGTTIEIGSDFESLCHELLHVTEFRSMGEADYLHLTWNVNQYKLIEQYLEVLKQTEPL